MTERNDTLNGSEPFRLATALLELREPLVAVVLAAAWLGFSLWPGVVLFPGQAPAARQDEAKAGLATPSQPPAGSREGAPPVSGPATPSDASASRQMSVPLQAAVLADRLDGAVVMIAGTDKSGKPVSGTGFFVSQNMIVTNRHVVDKIEAGSLNVASKRLQQAQPPQIVAKSADGATLQVRDLALLKTESTNRDVLKLGPSPSKLTPIVAVGFPEYLLDGDSVVSSGVINQKPESLPVKFLTHSAKIGKGGAGGPIVDLCGRVVGVNTAATSEGDPAQSNAAGATAYFAQDVTELEAFLKANGVSPVVDQAPCAADQAPAQPGPRR